MAGRRGRDRHDVKHRLGSCLADRADEVAIQGEPPAEMHGLQLLHHRMELFHQFRSAGRPALMVYRRCFVLR